jgi:plastocyanin
VFHSVHEEDMMNSLKLSFAEKAHTPREAFTRIGTGLAVAAFLLSWVGLAGADTIIVDVKSNVFSPNEVTINAGDTVRWVWYQGVNTTT